MPDLAASVSPAPSPAPATLDASPDASLDVQLSHELATLDDAGLRRRLRPLTRVAGAELRAADGVTLLDFASNDYLGLAADPRPAAAAAELLAREGLGAGAARLISGDHPAHHALEEALAALKGTPRALLFSSGWAANAGALPALAGREDAIYADALNHASLIDGARLSRATVRVFPHGDLAALDGMLHEDASRFRRRWIVVEGVYSMDGDLCPLDALVAIARAHGAFTYVDDAHATGVLGPDGRGSAAHWGVTVDVTVGTLGKALGTAGAFVAGSAALCDLLLHRARSFVFTTGTPPALAAATLHALAVAHDEPWRRTRVRAVAARLRAGLAAMGRPAPGAPDGHVVPVPVGDPRATLAVGEALRARGYLVGAIRPPTVPPGGSRLRVSASAAHTDAQVDGLLAALAETL
ncbi:aminotransferase class I/II-fold pyridoxal phosphate-dependent enzyme [Roseisolibacter agri]|uniref:8-amino-7-oxononanoate synthase n=1 Tax=Roseisolibacter agri TaxID=2014610 RepID=A0AA37V1N7_9BACT|nr:8-amino-7-oxononanoate synthase [Roseisolibacter agri]GLC24072.1 8-amino-7-oxononanoate synthase [Roseisolibacter agri]